MPFDATHLRRPAHMVHLPPVMPEGGGGGPRRIHVQIEIIDRRSPPTPLPRVELLKLLVALILLVAIFGCAAHAQPTSWQSYPFGSGRNYTGTDARGGQWSARSYQNGGTTYFDATGPDGRNQHCQSYELGSQTITECQ
jgi:hypothetical protein